MFNHVLCLHGFHLWVKLKGAKGKPTKLRRCKRCGKKQEELHDANCGEDYWNDIK